MSKPTIVFVHGAWHSAQFFEKVIPLLEPLGYKCTTVALPSVGSVPPVKSLDEDIEVVRTAVMQELDAGRDVMVNAHSWGGLPVCSALDGLSRPERETEGKKSAVTKLAFVSGFLVEEGISLEMAVGGKPEPWWTFPTEDSVFCDDFQSILYHDVPEEEAKKWIAQLKPHALSTLREKSRSAAWRKIPSSYLICEDDRAIPVQAQDGMIGRARELGGEIETERLFVSHSPYLVKPEYVSRFLRRAAGENVTEKS